MAVREFDGTDDTIHHAIDVLSGMTFGTVAAIFAHSATAADKHIAIPHTSGGSFQNSGWLSITPGTTVYKPYMYSSGFSAGPDSSLTSGSWYLIVARKATGTATPRFSIFNLTSPGWTHGNGDAALANWPAPGASGTVRTEVEGAEFFDGRLAVRAVWANEVHWSADTAGDSAIEVAGLEDSLQNWIDEAPDALWVFNQAVTTDPVDDLIANCDQTSLTGTTVITDDDPPGFDFEPPPPSPPAPNLFLSRSLQNR